MWISDICPMCYLHTSFSKQCFARSSLDKILGYFQLMLAEGTPKLCQERIVQNINLKISALHGKYSGWSGSTTNKKEQMPPRRRSLLTRGFQIRAQHIRISVYN